MLIKDLFIVCDDFQICMMPEIGKPLRLDRNVCIPGKFLAPDILNLKIENLFCEKNRIIAEVEYNEFVYTRLT